MDIPLGSPHVAFLALITNNWANLLFLSLLGVGRVMPNGIKPLKSEYRSCHYSSKCGKFAVFLFTLVALLFGFQNCGKLYVNEGNLQLREVASDTDVNTGSNENGDSLPIDKSKHWEQVPLSSKALRLYLENKGITPAGGEGMQFIHHIAYAPSNPKVAFLGVDTDTIWKSTDGGTTWRRKGKGIKSNGIISITVDPKNEKRVFVTGAQYTEFWGLMTDKRQMPLGIYRTLDGGENWKLVKQAYFGSMGWAEGNWGANTISFAGDNTLYVGTDQDGLLKSTDGGDTWSTILDFKTIGRIWAVKTHPTDSSTVFVGTSNGLKKMTASGSLSAIGNGLIGVVTAILISHTNPQILIVGDHSNRIMKSEDGGATFSASFTHSIAIKDTAWMAMSPVDPNYVFVSFAKRSYFSQNDDKMDFYYTHNAMDSNVEWKVAESMDEKVVSNGIDYGWVCGSISVKFASGPTWGEFMGGPIAMHPTNKNIALFFGGPGVVKKTTDGGANWHYSNAGYTAMAGMAKSLFSWDRQKARGFATTNSDRGIYFSDDNELTFKSYRTPSFHKDYESRGYGVAVGYGPTEDVIVGALGSHEQQILTVSRDKGDTWTQIKNPNTAGYYLDQLITFSPTDPMVIYAGKFKSVDGGVTWTQLSRKVDAVYWGNGDIVYSMGSSSSGNILIFKSENGGSTWPTTSPFPEIPTANNSVTQIVVSPTNANKIYFGKRSVGIYILNGSAPVLFRNEKSGLLRDFWGEFAFMSIAIDPNNDQVVYVANLTGIRGHDDKSIFRSVDGGLSWQTINFNLDDNSINNVSVNPHNSYVYVGTWGGIWKLPPPYNLEK